MNHSGANRTIHGAQIPKWVALAFSIIIDLIGMISYLLPGIGESFDIPWAPASAALVHYLYGNWYLTMMNFVEEISPGIDFIPTATIAWYLKYYGLNNSRRRE